MISLVRFPDYSAVVAMKILDPHLKDGVHEWRDGKRFVKESVKRVKFYLEVTGTLASRFVQVPREIPPVRSVSKR